MASVVAKAAPHLRRALGEVTPLMARLVAAAAAPDRSSAMSRGLLFAGGGFPQAFHTTAREAEKLVRTVTVNGKKVPENSVDITPVIRDGESRPSTYIVQVAALQGAPTLLAMSEEEIRDNAPLNRLVQEKQHKDVLTRKLTETLKAVYREARTEQEVEAIEEGLIQNFKRLEESSAGTAASILATAGSVAKIQVSAENLKNGTPVKSREEQQRDAMDARLKAYLAGEEDLGRSGGRC